MRSSSMCLALRIFSADISSVETEWRRKEAGYLQTIRELKNLVGKTETERIEAMKCDVGLPMLAVF